MDLSRSEDIFEDRVLIIDLFSIINCDYIVEYSNQSGRCTEEKIQDSYTNTQKNRICR